MLRQDSFKMGELDAPAVELEEDGNDADLLEQLELRALRLTRRQHGEPWRHPLDPWYIRSHASAAVGMNSNRPWARSPSPMM